MTAGAVQVTVRFITIMHRYSGQGNWEVQMKLSPRPEEALAQIIK